MLNFDINDEVMAVILGGGVGSRLFPLTAERAKPAVPIAGKYRLIDIPISNCINSGLYRIAVLTQFTSVSLHRHITRTYQFDLYHPGWVQIWAAEQRLQSSDWYQGTADAVRKQQLEIRTTGARHVLVLSGDHLYRMDYAALTDYHVQNNADVTIAVHPVPSDQAPRLGILKCDPSGRIVQFAEKPKDPELLAQLVSRDDPQNPYLGSMGIYLFKTQVLFELLANPAFEDFGRDIIPSAIQSRSVYGFIFDGYWEDIGTIRSFYETNLMLTQPDPPFKLNDPRCPIYTRPRFLPGSVIQDSALENVMLAEGCNIRKASIRNTVVGVRSQIGEGVHLLNCVLLGADFYDQPEANTSPDFIPLGIGENCWIEGAIIDKNARIAHDVTIRPFPPGTDLEGNQWVVRDGIVVIRKNGVLQPGTYVGPEMK